MNCKIYRFIAIGTFDFLGMNFYTSNLVRGINATEQGYVADQDAEFTKDEKWLG